MSILSPSRTKGGSVDVTMTAATFFVFKSALLIVTPYSRSMFATDCKVSSVLFESPVPLRPTTRP